MTRSTASRAPRPSFRCHECGAAVIRWVGRCPECQAWGTVAEVGPAARGAATVPGPVTSPATSICDLDPEQARARATGVDELDRVLGGGLVRGSVVLLAGEPGVGKSTLLLTVADHFARSSGQRALIVTGEESAAQVRLRAERTGALHGDLFLAAENDLAAVLTHVETVSPGLLVLDSVQTVTTDSVDGVPGGVPQIRAVAAGLTTVAKRRGMCTIIVGHVTKDGAIAGPRLLEHVVDVVLYFEGERHSALRLLRATKNRYGAADEVGCFEMREEGVSGLADPSGLFLSDRPTAVPGTCVTVTIEGRRPLVTEIQALVTPAGSPRRSVTGLDSNRVAMLLAVLGRHADMPLMNHEVYAATVGGLKAGEPASDLAIGLAVGSAARSVPLPPTLCAIGEVSLSGDVRRVGGVERRLAEAARLGFRTVLIPAANEPITPPADLRIVPVRTIGEALEAASGLREELDVPRRPAFHSIRGGTAESPRLSRTVTDRRPREYGAV